jgi:hypothetical protein
MTNQEWRKQCAARDATRAVWVRIARDHGYTLGRWQSPFTPVYRRGAQVGKLGMLADCCTGNPFPIASVGGWEISKLRSDIADALLADLLVTPA